MRSGVRSPSAPPLKTTFVGTLRASFAFPKQPIALNSFQGEDDDFTITRHDRRTFVVLIRYHSCARLAAVAGAGAEWDLAGERSPQRLAEGWTETAVAGKRHRRRLFDAVSCRVADLCHEQPRHGQ